MQILNGSLKRLIHETRKLYPNVAIRRVVLVELAESIALFAIRQIRFVFFRRKLAFVSGIGHHAAFRIVRDAGRMMNVRSTWSPKTRPGQFEQTLSSFQRQQLLHRSLSIRSLADDDSTAMVLQTRGDN